MYSIYSSTHAYYIDEKGVYEDKRTWDRNGKRQETGRLQTASAKGKLEAQVETDGDMSLESIEKRGNW